MGGLLSGVAPVRTERRLALSLLKTGLRRPTRFRNRLNRGNVGIFRVVTALTIRCNICGHLGKPYYDLPDIQLRKEHGIGVLRETLQCRACGSTLRDRSLAAALLQRLGRLEHPAVVASAMAQLPTGIRILDTDSYSPLSELMSGHPGYYRSVYAPDGGGVTGLDGGRIVNVNLESLSFADESFDVILTSDVMEHVRNYRAAHSEIVRCLRPGGAYIFNVPYNENLCQHRVLVDTSTDRDIPLEPEHIHGDPVRGGIKAYRIFGRQLIVELAELGLTTRLDMIDDAAIGVFRGDVFIAEKAEPLMLL